MANIFTVQYPVTSNSDSDGLNTLGLTIACDCEVLWTSVKLDSDNKTCCERNDSRAF